MSREIKNLKCKTFCKIYALIPIHLYILIISIILIPEMYNITIYQNVGMRNFS